MKPPTEFFFCSWNLQYIQYRNVRITEKN